MIDHSPTEHLLLKAQGGDRAAFDQLMKTFGPRLESLVRLRLGSELRARVEVDDILQETLVQAFRSINSLRKPNESAFFQWLAGIANHVIWNEARHQERRPAVPYEDKAAANDPTPSRILRRSERFDRLQEALNSLSPEHREVILLARIEGLSLAETAERMKRTQGAVAQLLWRALKCLRERFGDTESFHLPERRLEDPERPHGT
ncbi:MAG: sigma-70 family RNA polymerase sigma factor [Planctomycetes bacterium]|nr:sigma-70 family RNA polymerase sigma factor [Planctomycetota bacterium]